MGINIFDVLDNEFLGKLNNKDVENPVKCFIGISAIPQSGISTLADLLEERYKGVKVEKNAARNIIYANMEITDTKQVEDIFDEYIEKRIDNICKLSNKLIIWDGSIDRNFHKYQNWAKDNGYKTFVINLDTDVEIIKKRIGENKDPKTAHWYLLAMDKWQKDHEEYINNQQVHFTIKNNSDADYLKLYSTLDKILK